MTANTRIIPLLLLAFASACHDGPVAVHTVRISAVKQADGIRLTNLSDHATAYFVVDQNTLALIDWIKCNQTTPDCLRLPARGSVTVPFSEIAGYSGNGSTVVIYSWWVLIDIEGAPFVDADDPLVLKL